MKKVLFILLFILHSSLVYGATSDDVYLRKDVFEAKMDAFMAEVRLGFSEIRGEIKELSARMNGLEKQVDSLETSFNKRIDDTNNFLYLILVIIGAIPFIQKWLDSREIKKEKAAQSFTLDDVKKLINEAIRANNLTIQGK